MSHGYFGLRFSKIHATRRPNSCSYFTWQKFLPFPLKIKKNKLRKFHSKFKNSLRPIKYLSGLEKLNILQT